MAELRTFYDELGVAFDAADADIKRAFKELAKDYHPDHNPPDKQEWAHERMSRLNFIVETLLDSKARLEYHEILEEYRKGLARPRRTARQEYALQREYARVSVEIINLGEKYSNCRLKVLIGGTVCILAVLGLIAFRLFEIRSTLAIALAQFVTLVGLIMAGLGVSDFLGRGHYRMRIDELESRRSDLRRRMFEVWSSY